MKTGISDTQIPDMPVSDMHRAKNQVELWTPWGVLHVARDEATCDENALSASHKLRGGRWSQRRIFRHKQGLAPRI